MERGTEVLDCSGVVAVLESGLPESCLGTHCGVLLSACRVEVFPFFDIPLFDIASRCEG